MVCVFVFNLKKKLTKYLCIILYWLIVLLLYLYTQYIIILLFYLLLFRYLHILFDRQYSTRRLCGNTATTTRRYGTLVIYVRKTTDLCHTGHRYTVVPQFTVHWSTDFNNRIIHIDDVGDFLPLFRCIRHELKSCE